MGMSDKGGFGCRYHSRVGDNYRRAGRENVCGLAGCAAREGRPYHAGMGGNGYRARVQAGGCGCANVRTDVREGTGGCERRCDDMPVKRNCAECDALMQRLQKLDFSIQETVLYLDAYPDCCEAKAYYHQLVKERREVADAYEGKCGPLNAMGNTGEAGWSWGHNPWPWQPDFPGNHKM